MKRIAALLTVTCIVLIGLGVAARAQNSQLRNVRGTVMDKADAPVGSAVVYLKNARTLTVKTYISEDRGDYHFSGLDPNVDYELHAEKEGAKSQTRSVSSFDSRMDIVLNLKLEKKKS